MTPTRAWLPDAGPAYFAQPFAHRDREIFCVCPQSDLFDGLLSEGDLDHLFAAMALLRHHVFLVRTKRPARMHQYLRPKTVFGPRERVVDLMREFAERFGVARPSCQRGDFSNVWLGVSVSDQRQADILVPRLQAAPAFIRWVDATPLTGPLDLSRFMREPQHPDDPHVIDWVITGGGTQQPVHPDWVRSLRDQCKANDTAFRFAGWGGWSPCVLDEDEDGGLGAAYPLAGCSAPDAHTGDEEALFWQGDRLVHWPKVTSCPAVGARSMSVRRAGRLLDGVKHNGFPMAAEVPFA